MGRSPPMDLAPTVAWAIWPRTPGLAHIVQRPLERCAVFFVLPERKRLGPTSSRCDVESAGQRNFDPAGPPLQGERCRRGDVERHGLMHSPACREESDAIIG
jgi:hypothetical protein